MTPPENPPPNSRENFHETRIDFRLSWRMYRDNWKAFAGAQVVGILGFLATMVVTAWILLLFVPPQMFMDPLAYGAGWILFLTTIFVLPGLIVLFAFFGSLYGLSYDIMSSGDQFAEFSGTFQYFRRYWWQFFILSVWLNLLGFILPFGSLAIIGRLTSIGTRPLFVFPISVAFNYIWLILFIGMFPSLTAQKSLKMAFKENWRQLKSNIRHRLATVGIYLLIFEIPTFILTGLLSVFIEMDGFPPVHLPIGLIILAMETIQLFVGYPLLALLATRMYNSAKFNHTDENVREAPHDE